MSIDTRIQNCIDNHDEYVAKMATMPDKELIKKLDLVHIQSQIAEQTKNIGSLELLEVWRTQIIEARILKAENNIPDALNEIEIAVADIETTVALAEERQEIIESTQSYQKVYKSKIKEDNQDQMSLF
jgi:hypothetical protein